MDAGVRDFNKKIVASRLTGGFFSNRGGTMPAANIYLNMNAALFFE